MQRDLPLLKTRSERGNGDRVPCSIVAIGFGLAECQRATSPLTLAKGTCAEETPP
jgi:hypothetical protein